MVKKVMLHKQMNVGVKKFIALSRKGEKVVASSDTRKGLANLLKKKPMGNYFILENPKVREAEVTSVKSTILKHWEKSKEAQKNLRKGYLAIF